MDRPNQVKWITGYTVGYPSTAYYPGLLCDNFIYWAYPGGPPELLQYPEFTEGTAIYFANSSINRYPPESESEEKNNSYIAYTKIYNLMSYTPPDGYVLDDNGKYTYIAEAKIYSCNEDVKYFNAINSINIGTETIKREFRYKKKEIKDNKVNVKLAVSNDIIINGNTYHPQDHYKVINTIDLKSGDGNAMDILVSLDSNHYIGSFDIRFDGCPISNKKIYLSVNSHLYQVNGSAEAQRCYISRYKYSFRDDGYMFTTSGFDYTFNSSAWDSNGLFTLRNIRDDFGESIPSETKMKYVVKFTLDNGDYRQDCQLTVDVTTNK